MTTNDLENDINRVDKAANRFEKIDSSFKRSSPVGEMFSDSITCHREIVNDGKS